MEFITNHKGGLKLCFEGYMYTKRCSSSNQIQWQCPQRAAFKCNGSLYTSLENQNPHATKPHTHEPDVKAVKVAKAKTAMKQQAKKSREKPGQILSTHPKEPDSLSELEIEGEWSETSTGQRFLVHDSGKESSQRVIVFASNEGIRQLAMKGEWYMDGTFNTAPKLFNQLYVIRARLGQSAVTCAYALLTGKSQELYEEMLQAISRAAEELGFTLDPESVHLHSEGPVINAVKNTFGSRVNTKAAFTI